MTTLGSFTLNGQAQAVDGGTRLLTHTYNIYQRARLSQSYANTNSTG